MKKSVIRLLCAAALLLTMAWGAMALSSGDSLVSLKYLQETFIPSAVTQGETAANAKLQETYDAAKAELDAFQKELTGEEGTSSATLQPRDFDQGDVTSLATGSGALLFSGQATVTHNGAVIDVTEGRELASGSRLTAGHRYLVGEDTTANLTVISGAARLGLQGSYTFTAGDGSPNPFYDVCRTDWYYEPVNYVYTNGLFSGMDEHTFGPGQVMTRAMVMTVLYQMAGAPAEELQAADVTFSDVPETAWYAPYVKWGAAQGITAGTSQTTFSPDQQVTRQQVAALLYSFATKYLGLEAVQGADLSGYQDLEKADSWARESLSWAVAAGIMSSSSTDALTLSPQKTANRAEMATMLKAFSEKILPAG